MFSLEILESLSAASSLDELHASCRAISRQLGYEHFLYAVRFNLSPTRPYQFIFSGYPRTWREHYEAQGYAQIDPTIEHCAREVVPVIWSPLMFSGGKKAMLAEEASAYGLVSGSSIPIHGRAGEAGMLSLANDRSPQAARKDIVATLGNAHLFACYLHEAVRRLALTSEGLPLKGPVLTPREKECLLWAAEGKTSWEIAQILHVSERTIVFHLANAANKMGVNNRRQAVVRALSLGLITP